jgi:hypothetical protein
MTVSITHTHQTAIANDPSKDVSANVWNATHTISMATARLLGRTTASAGSPEEITVGSGLSLSAGALTATAAGTMFNVVDYGAVGDGVTNNATAVASRDGVCTNKGGILYFPYSQAGYKFTSSTGFYHRSGQWNSNGNIIVMLNGNIINHTGAGWAIDVATNFFGTNNSGFSKRIVIHGDSAQILGSSARARRPRATDNVGSIFESIGISGYSRSWHRTQYLHD